MRLFHAQAFSRARRHVSVMLVGIAASFVILTGGAVAQEAGSAPCSALEDGSSFDPGVFGLDGGSSGYGTAAPSASTLSDPGSPGTTSLGSSPGSSGSSGDAGGGAGGGAVGVGPGGGGETQLVATGDTDRDWERILRNRAIQRDFQPLRPETIRSIIVDRAETPAADVDLDKWLNDFFATAQNIAPIEYISWNTRAIPDDILKEMVRTLTRQLGARNRSVPGALQLLRGLSECLMELDRRGLRSSLDCSVERVLSALWLSQPDTLRMIVIEKWMIDPQCMFASEDGQSIAPRFASQFVWVLQNPAYDSATVKGIVALVLQYVARAPAQDQSAGALAVYLNSEIASAASAAIGAFGPNAPQPRVSLRDLIALLKTGLEAENEARRFPIVKAFADGGIITTLRVLLMSGNPVLTEGVLDLVIGIIPYLRIQEMRDGLADDLIALAVRILVDDGISDAAERRVYDILSRAVLRDGLFKQLLQRKVDVRIAGCRGSDLERQALRKIELMLRRMPTSSIPWPRDLVPDFMSPPGRPGLEMSETVPGSSATPTPGGEGASGGGASSPGFTPAQEAAGYSGPTFTPTPEGIAAASSFPTPTPADDPAAVSWSPAPLPTPSGAGQW